MKLNVMVYKTIFLIILSVLNSSLLHASDIKPFIECFTYFKSDNDEGTGQSKISNVQSLKFSETDKVTEVSNTENPVNISLFLKPIDENKILVVDQSNRVNSTNPEFIMDLEHFSYIEQSSTLMFVEDYVYSLRALCFKSENANKAPFYKNFNYMIAHKIQSLDELEFNNLKL